MMSKAKPKTDQSKAVFRDGEPTNLPAAALDALEWLEWLHRYSDGIRVFSQKDSRQRLKGAIRNLKKHLEPFLPEECE
jgi:hypothetical protein